MVVLLEVFLPDGDVYQDIAQGPLSSRRLWWSTFEIGRRTARELHLEGTEIGGMTLADDNLFELAWAALPVGFFWSLFFCQGA